MVGASVEAEAVENKVVAVMEMVEDGVTTMVLVKDGVAMILMVGAGPYYTYKFWAGQTICLVTLCVCEMYRMPVLWTPCDCLPSPPWSKGPYG